MAADDDSPAAFYDDWADDYHLIFADFEATIRWQGTVVAGLLERFGDGVRRVLDTTCGIGTQSLGLAHAGFDVTATGISERSVARCALEAAALRRVLAPGGLLCASIRDYDAVLASRPTGDPPRTHRTDTGERVVFQVWEWETDTRYRVRHFLLERAEAEPWRVTERCTTYRALRPVELETALRAAGFASPVWLTPEESGFYQPVVARAR